MNILMKNFSFERGYIQSLKFSFVIVLSFLLSLSFFPLGGAKAFNPESYSCPSNNHCYGLVQWSTLTLFQGGQTNISIVPLSCVGCVGGQFIDNEMWLIDFDAYICQISDNNACWVEAGYGTFIINGISVSKYFWADQRPYPNAYAEHFLTSPSAGDTEVSVGINSISSSAYSIHLNSDTQTLSGQSTNNQMQPADLEIGQELVGTNGAHASTAHFTFNGYYTGPNGNLTFNYFTQDGGGHNVKAPIVAGWTTVPAPGNFGGNYYTSCAC